ncbi:undecaprenyl-diphosphate phosphatase [Natroniella sp. ANB-PHB2]|uniref:undecaprenyl-diphosphate phosphatase n=1 Tax=Natroniella sp. ANB-PHB2 TaxID=3384444 RepID=UPI0038D3F9E8
MDLIEVIILGIVQGIVDPMPVSSSGHLVLVQHLFGIQERLTLSIFLHFGTLIAIMIVFWQDIIGITKFRSSFKYRKFTKYILIGIIPAGVIGVIFKGFFEGVFASTIVVGVMLLVTGTLLWISERVNDDGRKMEEMEFSDSLVVGFAQAAAIFPGLSRSGTTIIAGLFKGLDRELAVRYSFLLSIPVVLGATLLQAVDLMRVGIGEITVLQIIVGTMTSVISGYLALKLLLKIVEKQRLSLFAYYCWALGFLVIWLVG